MRNADFPQGMARNAISLLLGHPNPSTLITPEMQDTVQSMLASQATRAFQYGPEQGLSITPSNLMIVAGSTHAVDMIARLYAKPDKPGGVVLVEAPSYADSIHIFRDHRVELWSVPMDDDRLIPADLEIRLAELAAQGKWSSLLYTIPTYHNPMGVTLTSERRRHVIEMARQYGFRIIEDDVYRDLSFAGTVPPKFYALANGQQVLSIGSFSKILAPGLRLGWLIGSEEDIQRCVNCGTTQMGGGANPFTANIIAAYCRKGYLEPHVASLKAVYRNHRDMTLAALARCMPEGVAWTHPTGDSSFGCACLRAFLLSR